ncbi:MAG: polysaccharide biosynthesis C-terminal domain-containing protein [Planctomycetota bacterium]
MGSSVKSSAADATSPATVEVRVPPQPDPIRLTRLADSWRRPATLVALALAAGVAATVALPAAWSGILACAAALLAATWLFRSRDWVHFGWCIHGGVGVVTLAIARGWAESGAYAPFACGVVLAGLVVRFVGTYSRPVLLPLAGRIPWLFRRVARQGSLRHGAVGLALGLLCVLFATRPEARVLGVALLPLSLRGLACELLAPAERRILWQGVMTFHVGLAVILVPDYGVLGAAWSVVAAETLLFLGSSLAIARHTRSDLLPRAHWACFCGILLLMAVLSLPLPLLAKIFALPPILALVGLVFHLERKLSTTRG